MSGRYCHFYLQCSKHKERCDLLAGLPIIEDGGRKLYHYCPHSASYPSTVRNKLAKSRKHDISVAFSGRDGRILYTEEDTKTKIDSKGKNKNDSIHNLATDNANDDSDYDSDDHDEDDSEEENFELPVQKRVKTGNSTLIDTQITSASQGSSDKERMKAMNEEILRLKSSHARMEEELLEIKASTRKNKNETMQILQCTAETMKQIRERQDESFDTVKSLKEVVEEQKEDYAALAQTVDDMKSKESKEISSGISQQNFELKSPSSQGRNVSRTFNFYFDMVSLEEHLAPEKQN